MNLQDYIEILDENSSRTIKLAYSISDDALTLKLPGKWSPLEILEHIFLTDKIVLILLSRPSVNKHTSTHILGSEKLEKFLIDGRNHKVEAPEALHPKGLFPNLDAFEIAFLEQRKQLKLKLDSGEIIMDNRIHKHIRLGEMTISDWLYFIIHHTNRHLEQIQDML